MPVNTMEANGWPTILSHKHTSDLKTISEELYPSMLCFKTGVMVLVVRRSQIFAAPVSNIRINCMKRQNPAWK